MPTFTMFLQCMQGFFRYDLQVSLRKQWTFISNFLAKKKVNKQFELNKLIKKLYAFAYNQSNAHQSTNDQIDDDVQSTFDIRLTKNKQTNITSCRWRQKPILGKPNGTKRTTCKRQINSKNNNNNDRREHKGKAKTSQKSVVNIFSLFLYFSLFLLGVYCVCVNVTMWLMNGSGWSAYL